MKNKAAYYVYMVRCSDGTYYTGYTNDIEKRLAAHNSGKGAKYTRSHRPVKIVWEKCYSRLGAALSEEYRIKSLSRAEKIRLVRHERMQHE